MLKFWPLFEHDIRPRKLSFWTKKLDHYVENLRKIYAKMCLKALNTTYFVIYRHAPENITFKNFRNMSTFDIFQNMKNFDIFHIFVDQNVDGDMMA